MDKLLDTIQENFDKFRFVIKFTFIGSLVAIALAIIVALCCKTCNSFFKDLNANPQKSIEKIDFLLKIAPKSASLYYLKGHAYLNLEEYDKSLDFLKNHLNLKKLLILTLKWQLRPSKKKGGLRQKFLICLMKL